MQGPMPEPLPPVRLLGLREALRTYVQALETQSTRLIRPLHWYMGNRLVIEGGFHPEDVTPRPPFRVESRGSGRTRSHLLIHDESVAGSGEHTIPGGLKTKQVDVTVSKPGIGPCVAVSVKGTVGAFRNLTNRMEEAIGDCTNLHISYPNLVYGFLHVIKANLEGQRVQPNDVAVLPNGRISDSIQRYHDAMAELTGRRGVRNDYTRYEAVALVLASASGDAIGEVLPNFPTGDSRLGFATFFETLYRTYDHRFVYAAPDLQRSTRRLEWDPTSPAIPVAREFSIEARLSAGSAAEE